MTDAPRSFPHPVYEQVVLQPYFRDAVKYYYHSILAANKAHVVMLYKTKIIDLENAKALLRVLKEMETHDPAATAYRSGVEDLFFAIENRLIEMIGPAYGGNIQLGEPNDLGYALTRLAMTAATDTIQVLDLAHHPFRAPTSPPVMPGYTHTQPAAHHDGSLYSVSVSGGQADGLAKPTT
jgi:argininosuccinate lyase